MAQGRLRDGASVERILILARNIEYRQFLQHELERRGFQVFGANDRMECLRLLATARPQVLVADVQATGTLASIPDNARVPLVTLASVPTEAAMRALVARSAKVLTKPVSIDEIILAIEEAASANAPTSLPVARTQGDVFEPRSPAMLAVLEDVERLRDADCPVLILGETGTGKTVLARRLHAIGARPSGNFVDLNCAGLSYDFVESELFGHERGSFTGAHAAKPGLLDVAHGGTLFLDEIGDIDLRVQPKVLKVLEEKRYRRLGDVRERDVDVRLIAATHHDLVKNVAERSFRADLYYRISTITILVPPLRERLDDILPLAMSMLQRRGFASTLSPSAQERLLEYSWPGNIRELKNVVERAAILRPSQVLEADDLRFDSLTSTSAPISERAVATATPLLGATASSTTREELERAHIQLVLAAENGHVESAARRLGIPRSTLYWKLKRYGLRGGSPDRLRASSG